MKLMTVIFFAICVAGSAAWAQSDPNTTTVNGRRENQQDRIAQGVRSGQLTAGETSNLETKESSINQEVRTDRSLNGGRLTAQERQTVNQQQNSMSRQIYTDKHNAAQQTYGNNMVGARRENQQDRIANGIQSGRLNAAQTARLENGEKNLNGEVRADRAANGGKLTGAEKQQINQQQNGMSRRIYNAKHK